MQKTLSLFLSILLAISSITVSVSASTAETYYDGYIYSVTDDYDYESDLYELYAFITVIDSSGISHRYACASTVTINGTAYTDIYEVCDAIERNTYAEFTLDADGRIDTLNYTSDFPDNRQVFATLYNVTYSNNKLTFDIDYHYIAKECVAFVGIYDRVGKLVNSSCDYVYEYGPEMGFSVTCDKSYIGHRVKLFFWDSFETLTPISDVFEATIVSEVSQVPYAYVTDISYDDNDDFGFDIFIQAVTPKGFETLRVNSSFVRWYKSDQTYTIITTYDYTESELQEFISEMKAALVNTVVKFDTNSSGHIVSITESGYNEERFNQYSRITSGATADFDAENSIFLCASDVAYVDANSAVFFINPLNISESYVGMLEEITDGASFTVLGIYYDNHADDNNIIALDATTITEATPDTEPETPGPTSSPLAVITDCSTSENSDGEEVYSLELMANGEQLAADTTAAVADKITEDVILSKGDLVKFTVGDDGLISDLIMVFDFEEGVRDFSTVATSAEDLASYAPNATKYADDTALESFIGGQVESYKKSSTLAVVAGNTIKLSQAQNVYVIDANGRKLEIIKSTAPNFKCYESLYNFELTNVTVCIDRGTEFKATQDQAKAAADYVYARLYDGKVVDLVIVKGIADLSVTDGDTIFE